MKIFKKAGEHLSSDDLAQRIADHILLRQSRIAAHLNRKTKDLSGKTLLLILIVFCTVMGGYLIYLLLGAIK